MTDHDGNDARTMKAVGFNTYGSAEVLQVMEVARPAPGVGEVAIAVAAIGVNPADFKWRSGAIGTDYPLPMIVGYDVAGVVDSLGQGVTTLERGDRVVATVNQGYAEVAIAKAQDCAKLPDDMDFDQAAALPCAAQTGEQLIEEAILPARDQTVLITGATGGVGRFALKAARDMGIRVIAAVRPEYIDEARAYGADATVALGSENDIAGMTFHHVADTVGGAAVARMARHMQPGGKICTVATLPIPHEGLPAEPQFMFYHADGERLRRIVDDVASARMTMPVSHRFALSNAAEAHRLLEAGGLRGRIVLHP